MPAAMRRRPARPSMRRRTSLALVAAVMSAVSLSACTAGTASVPLDTDADKPFLLRGVSAVTEIAQLTGPGALNDTEAVGVAGTDLGSMTTIGDRTYFFFGDTFGERDPDSYGGQGGFWRSNVSAWTTDDDPSDGITFDGWAPVDEFGLAAAMVEGAHDPNDGAGEVTKIPTYGFAIGETLYLHYMSVSRWGAAGEWEANHSGLARSHDRGATWTLLEEPQWPGDSNFIQVATAHIQDAGNDWVYFWSIPAGRFGGVQLMRVPATEEAVEDPSAYSYFTGTDARGRPRWAADRDAAETILDGAIGELSAMWSEYLQRWVVTYSEAGNAYIREGLTPWGPWGEAIEIAAQSDYPGLYSPYLNPRYVADGGRRLYFTMSLWGPYNVFWFSLDLERAP